MKWIAIVRIRGRNNVKNKVEDTMRMLRLFNKHSCVIVKSTDSVSGMIMKIKDYVSWGEVEEATVKALLEKRGRLAGKNKLTEAYLKEKLKLNFDDFIKELFEFKKELKDIPGLKLFFKLKPPEGGFEKAGIKKSFSVGGSLGYRGNKINNLIIRMI